MGHNIFLLDISHLTEMDMVSFIKGEIVLSDNMEIPFSEPLEQLPQNDFPVQAGMSMVLFCLQGELHVRISLKEYTLRPDMFCVIITGMIFEVLSISNDFRGFMIATRTNFMPVTEKTTQVMSFYKCLQSRHCFVLEEKEVMAFVGVYHSIKATLQELDHPYRIPMLQSYVQILYYRMLPIVLKEEESRSKYSHTRQEEIFQRFIGEVEKHHEERYRKLLENVKDGEVFKKGSIVVWKCRNCGHIVVGTEAPKVCPVCNHPQSFFEVNAENY